MGLRKYKKLSIKIFYFIIHTVALLYEATNRDQRIAGNSFILPLLLVASRKDALDLAAPFQKSTPMFVAIT